MNKNCIVNAGIRLTRRCNMKCTYCNIQKADYEELSYEEWKKAINIIKDLGATEIVILGGEPTLYPKVIELVDYISNQLKMTCNLTTNAFDNFEIATQLLKVGLNSIGVSVDNLQLKKSISPLKSKNGLRLINYLLEKCDNPSITNYTVLNRNNVDSILDLIRYMDKKGVFTYILPFHWGNEGTFDHRKNNEQFAFISDEDIKLYNQVIDKIIELKQSGVKIKNSINFLEMSKKHIKDLDWKCSGLSELRIDSDGKLVCCCDKIGNVNKSFTIFDLKNNLEQFFIIREEDSNACKGCLWPSSFEAELKKAQK